MIATFEKHINLKFPFIKDSKLLIAISGGIDSVVLTQLLHLLKFDITLAHCNFKLREKESDLDEEFIKNLAKKLNVACHTISFDTEIYAKNNGLSIQMAARELRYNWFDSLLVQNELDYLVTGHQKDDILETFLINFSRGTGLDGLTGIPEINGKTIRPLLPFSRNEVENFAKKNKLEWREDASNSSIKYIRNKIRHSVIPVLKQLNPSLLDSFDKTLRNLKDSKAIINDALNKIKTEVVSLDGDVIKLDIEKLKKLSNPKAYLFELLKEYNFTEWNDIEDLLYAQSGKQVFSKSHRLIKDRAYLILSKVNLKDERSWLNIESETTVFSNSSINLTFKNCKNTAALNHDSSIAHVDKELLKFPLIVRKWKKGDYFYPIGMKGKKKLSKFFKDEKLSLLEKENIWLLCSSNDEIIWIIDKRLDNRFKITTKTNQSLKITYLAHEKNN